MASGSYFTLYRKYSVKAPDTVIKDICKRYVTDITSTTIYDKNDAAKHIPLVIEPNYGIKESEYDESTKKWKDVRDYSIDGQRKQFHAILKEDGSYLDELLTWHFCSSFTCLKSEWNLDSYVGSRSSYLISKSEAFQILQACNYLLSEKWSAEFEKILNNKWIKILSSGNESESYWKYVYRDNKKMLKDIPEEEIDSAEYDIRKLQHVMDAFTSVDEDYSSYGKVDNILVYKAW